MPNTDIAPARIVMKDVIRSGEHRSLLVCPICQDEHLHLEAPETYVEKGVEALRLNFWSECGHTFSLSFDSHFDSGKGSTWAYVCNVAGEDVEGISWE